MGVLVVIQGNILLLFLLLMALVVIVMWLAQPALEEIMLSARPVMALFMLWSMQMNVEEFVVQEITGNPMIIHVSPVWLPVSTVLEMERMIVPVAL
jgi:hypothetical protein